MKRLPKCLHTCLQCSNAVVCEEYSDSDRHLVFDGCWIYEDIVMPIPREDCRKFQECKGRIDRKYWETWNWKVHFSRGNRNIQKAKTIQITKGHTELGNVNQSLSYRADQFRTCHAESSENTKALILQALTCNIYYLNGIAQFAGVHPSTACYHLNKLIQEGKVARVFRGRYVLSGSHFFDDPTHGSHFFDTCVRYLSESADDGLVTLAPTEKDILKEILSDKNRYEKYSERELARRCNVSRNTVKKYVQELEKKKLIEIRQEHHQYVFIPTDVVVQKVAEFQSVTGADNNPAAGRCNGRW